MYTQMVDQGQPKEAKTWGMLCHLAGFAGYLTGIGQILGPLIVWILKKDQYAFVDDQGKEALNYNISMTLWMIIAGLSIFLLVGFVLLPVLALVDIILKIVAAVKANEGVAYRYPLTIRFLK